MIEELPIPVPPERWLRARLRECYRLMLDSPDRSTQNAAKVYGIEGAWTPDAEWSEMGDGVNRFTFGFEPQPEHFERPLKYAYTEHAERNAIFASIHSVESVGGFFPTMMICPWAACADCARAIVQSGIRVLVRHQRDDDTGRWGDSITHGDAILAAGDVEVITVRGALGGCDPILFNGAPWNP